jgi:hypothetical protein
MMSLHKVLVVNDASYDSELNERQMAQHILLYLCLQESYPKCNKWPVQKLTDHIIYITHNSFILITCPLSSTLNILPEKLLWEISILNNDRSLCHFYVSNHRTLQTSN